MKQKNMAIFKASSLDWRTGWVTEVEFRLTSSDILEITTRILDEPGRLYSSKVVKVELDTPKPFSEYEFVVSEKIGDLAKRDLTTLYLSGDISDVETALLLGEWSRDVTSGNLDLTPADTKYRPVGDFAKVTQRFDGNQRFELIANGERYLVLRTHRSAEVVGGLLGVSYLEKLTAKEILTLSKSGGSWADWTYSIYYDSANRRSICCLDMGEYKVYATLEGNPASVIARALRYELQAIFAFMNERGVPNFPTGMWGDWILQQYMIQGLRDFRMLKDKFSFKVNLSGKELTKFRQEMLEPWNIKGNNDSDLKSHWNAI